MNESITFVLFSVHSYFICIFTGRAFYLKYRYDPKKFAQYSGELEDDSAESDDENISLHSINIENPSEDSDRDRDSRIVPH